MFSGVIVLITTDALLAMVAWMAANSRRAESHQGFPLWLAGMMCVTALALHLAAYAYCASQAFGGDPWRPDPALMAINAASGLVPAVLCGYLLLQAVSGAFMRGISGSGPDPMPETFDKARRLVKAGNIDGAIAEYRRLADAFPKSPEPLLAAAGVLEAVGSFEDAARTLGDTMRRFESADQAWARAAQRLSELLKTQLQRPLEAALLDRKIAERERRREAKKSKAKPAPFEHRNRAEAHLANADTDSAVHQYWQQFAVNPSSPRPLFSAATAMESAHRYFEAVDILRGIVQRFRHDDAVWSDAAYRLALLLEIHLGDHASARTLYRQIVERSPQSKAGHLAGARLGQYLSPPPEQ